METVSVAKAAELYGLPENTLRGYCKRGILKAQKVGKHWYITPAELNRLFKGETDAKKCD